MLQSTIAPSPSQTVLYVADAARPRRLERALEDISTGFARWRLAAALARLDIRNRYRGSVLGPFWLSLSTAVMVVALGLLYSTLFTLPLGEYLPYLSVGLIVWGLINQTVTDACESLISAEGIIRQLPLPYTVHALRCVFRNAAVAAHSLPLILVVFAVFGHLPGPEALLAFAGLALVGANAFALSIVLGMVCARFRDIPPIVGSVLQLAFFMSPVLWKPELLGDRRVWLPLNPFYTLMETVRGPLVEGGAPGVVWLSAIAFTLLTCASAFAFFVRFRGRIAFWV
ncbi:ABC transporter permease [Craurococcus roseus]|uniref:ABC transporter permease n=1 Tax=Craurococcus roseus TaxID=77585 RepID=A0ABN1EWD3_9PROT